MTAEQKISSTVGNLVGPLDKNDHVAHGVANIGDLDGDNTVDILVGAAYDDDGGASRGAVCILFLNSDGTVKAEQKITSNAVGLVGPLDDQDLFGVSGASIGDLDVDGVTDIVVGSCGSDNSQGSVYVFF